MLVFDIETVPQDIEQPYSKAQLGYIEKKIEAAKRRDSDLDVLAKTDELKGIDPYLARIICIGLYFPGKDKRMALTNPDEHAILSSFWETIATHRDIFISYNGVKFDVPFIIRRSIKHRLAPTNNNFLQYTKYNTFPPHFDAILQVGLRETYYSLKEACDFFDIPSPKEGDIVAENVGKAFSEGRIAEIADYCLKDLEGTFQLYEKLIPFVR